MLPSGNLPRGGGPYPPPQRTWPGGNPYPLGEAPPSTAGHTPYPTQLGAGRGRPRANAIVQEAQPSPMRYTRATRSVQATVNSMWTTGYEVNHEWQDARRLQVPLSQPEHPLSPKSSPSDGTIELKPAKNMLTKAGHKIRKLFKGRNEGVKKGKGNARETTNAAQPVQHGSHAGEVCRIYDEVVEAAEAQQEARLRASREPSIEEIDPAVWLRSRLAPRIKDGRATADTDSKQNEPCAYLVDSETVEQACHHDFTQVQADSASHGSAASRIEPGEWMSPRHRRLRSRTHHEDHTNHYTSAGELFQHEQGTKPSSSLRDSSASPENSHFVTEPGLRMRGDPSNYGIAVSAGGDAGRGYTTHKRPREHDQHVTETEHHTSPAYKRHQGPEAYEACQPRTETYECATDPHHHARAGGYSRHHTNQNPGRGKATSEYHHPRVERRQFHNTVKGSQDHAGQHHYQEHGGKEYSKEFTAPPPPYKSVGEKVGAYNGANAIVQHGGASRASHRHYTSAFEGVCQSNEEERSFLAQNMQKQSEFKEPYDKFVQRLYKEQLYDIIKYEREKYDKACETGQHYSGGRDAQRNYIGGHYEGEHHGESSEPKHRGGKYHEETGYKGTRYAYENRHHGEEDDKQNAWEQTHHDQELCKPTLENVTISGEAAPWGTVRTSLRDRNGAKKSTSNHTQQGQHRHHPYYRGKGREAAYYSQEDTQDRGRQAEKGRLGDPKSKTKRGPIFGTFIPHISRSRRAQIATTVNADRAGSPMRHGKSLPSVHDSQGTPPYEHHYPEHMRPQAHYSSHHMTPSAYWSIRGREPTRANSPFLANTAPQDPFGNGHCDLPKRGGPRGGRMYGRAVKVATPGPAPEMGSLFPLTRGEKRGTDNIEAWGGFKVSRCLWDGRAVGKNALGREFVFGTREQIEWQG